MDLKKIREEERRQESNQRKEKMIEAAAKCFSQKGIEATSIVDIAREAEFGEATIYRYFSNKENLALACGIRFWEEAYQVMAGLASQEDYIDKSGYKQVECLMQGALCFFKEQQAAFRLIHNLDGFLLSHRVEEERLQDYGQAVGRMQPVLCEALDKGKMDGSITREEETAELYYALTNSIFGMMQKQAAAGTLLATDRAVDGMRKMELLMELLMDGLRCKRGD